MEEKKYTVKDYTSAEEPRWCPGCGDFSILAQVRTVLAELSIPPEKLVFVSGIGCSSRFPYYMNTYGLHGIHGRSPAIALGIKIINPELNVWIITGDGDGLSIGGNHLLHLFRRNLDVKVILFNNEIYGLTKGQVSPTSRVGTKSKSTPWGSFHRGINPIAFALGAGATFIARTMDRDPSHMRKIIKEAAMHKGVAFIEVLQNCVIYNDGAFFKFTEKDTKPTYSLFLENGKPAIFDNGKKAIVFKNSSVSIQNVNNGSIPEGTIIHDESNKINAGILCNVVDNLANEGIFPKPFGVIYKESSLDYYALANKKRQEVKEKKGTISVKDIIFKGNVWEISE